MQNLSAGRVLLTHNMTQVGNLLHTAQSDCFVTLYMQKHMSLDAAPDDDNEVCTTSLRIVGSNSSNALYIRNASSGCRPILENFPLSQGESLRVSSTVLSRHLVFGYATPST